MIDVFVLAKLSFLFLGGTLLLAQRTMVSYKLPQIRNLSLQLLIDIHAQK